MAHSKSAQKRVRQSEKRRAINRWRKLRVKDTVREFLTAVHDGNPEQAQEKLRTASRTIDKVAASGTIHKNAAARRKSRLAKRLNALKAAPAAPATKA